VAEEAVAPEEVGLAELARTAACPVPPRSRG